MNNSTGSGVVLAAGLANRMGNKPKALLEREGIALVRRAAECLLTIGLREVVVVVGHEFDRVTKVLQGLPLQIVQNPKPEEGQAKSLQLALLALSTPTTSVMISLADMPLIEPEHLTAIWRAFEQRPKACHIVQPFNGEKLGNPVVIDSCLANHWREAHTPEMGQSWRQKNPQSIHHWYTSLPHYFIDLDTPADLMRIQTEFGISLQWPNSI
jgi:CTP:molybdopterin cytidylyltransferase MocA